MIEFRPASGQVDDLFTEIRRRVERKERVLITTLTKRMAEDLTDYYTDLGIAVRYLHSDIKTLERIDIIHSLRLGEFDVLVGINLLREGLDIPEVSLVAILDADKEGFLRSTRSLIQTCGRAARNLNGRVIMYADTVTPSMREAAEETNRRRKIQEEFNRVHNITPASIEKKISTTFVTADYPVSEQKQLQVAETLAAYSSTDDLEHLIEGMEKEMREAARSLKFERAAQLRDRIRELRAMFLVAS
jgi:excinuclease ABC subunit B